jgi:hypothetical protein
MERTIQTTERRTRGSTPAERFRPNGVAGDVPREGTQLEQPARADRFIFHFCAALLCCALTACEAQTEPTQTADGGTCGLDLDARVTISVDGSQVFEGRASDFHPMPCAAPERTCSPWRATAECKAADGFTRQTWTLDGNEGSVTLETETRGAASTTEQLTLATVAR